MIKKILISFIIALFCMNTVYAKKLQLAPNAKASLLMEATTKQVIFFK